MDSPSSLKTVMSARFRRHAIGPPGMATAVVDDLDPSVVEPILNGIVLAEEELPVIASVLSPNEWSVITTSRVIVSSDGRTDSFRNKDIKDVNLDFDACEKEGPVLGPDQFSYISVEMFSGTQDTIHVEPGGGFRGILSVIKMIAEQSWRARGLEWKRVRWYPTKDAGHDDGDST